jgi:hypothetical protein
MTDRAQQNGVAARETADLVIRKDIARPQKALAAQVEGNELVLEAVEPADQPEDLE